jgi:hypothetical protein
MSQFYVTKCDVDDCFNNTMKNDNLYFYEVDIGNETAYTELHGKYNHICSDCLKIMMNDYPEIELDQKRDLVYYVYF